jgi:glycosyltransferase involved in cell wall biosynthesis
MASAVVSVNSVADQWYHRIPSMKRYIIPNPVQAHLDDVARTDKPPYHIVSLGRLERIKNHALLIRAFAKLADNFPDWDVQIYGSGREYASLQQLIVSLDLVGRVSLNLPVHDVADVLSGTAIYVQPSYAEGFPNAVLDAMACHVPVIVTDYQGNPRDLITHRETGVIVPMDDTVALVDTLRELMCDPTLRSCLGRSAGYVQEAFSIERVTQQWYDVIRQILD